MTRRIAWGSQDDVTEMQGNTSVDAAKRYQTANLHSIPGLCADVVVYIFSYLGNHDSNTFSRVNRGARAQANLAIQWQKAPFYYQLLSELRTLNGLLRFAPDRIPVPRMVPQIIQQFQQSEQSVFDDLQVPEAAVAHVDTSSAAPAAVAPNAAGERINFMTDIRMRPIRSALNQIVQRSVNLVNEWEQSLKYQLYCLSPECSHTSLVYQRYFHRSYCDLCPLASLGLCALTSIGLFIAAIAQGCATPFWAAGLACAGTTGICGVCYKCDVGQCCEEICCSDSTEHRLTQRQLAEMPETDCPTCDAVSAWCLRRGEYQRISRIPLQNRQSMYATSREMIDVQVDPYKYGLRSREKIIERFVFMLSQQLDLIKTFNLEDRLELEDYFEKFILYIADNAPTILPIRELKELNSMVKDSLIFRANAPRVTRMV